MPARRVPDEVPGGAMADIGFLLLVFFFVTTTIAEDRGILVRLPPWDERAVDIAARNVLHIHVNAANELMVAGQMTTTDRLPHMIRQFVLNPEEDASGASSPRKAVLSLYTDRSTAYAAYLEIYDTLKRTYRRMWEDESVRRYDIPYQDLREAQRQAVRHAIPFVVSEAEPTSDQK
ncbi:MAG: biopolymer transporter ExbD [Saprospiraceae bacterium]|nr:biopolymer transporter ExbD [Saprospiraceae bacterium]